MGTVFLLQLFFNQPASSISCNRSSLRAWVHELGGLCLVKCSLYHHFDECFPLNDLLPLGNRNHPDEGGFKHWPWYRFWTMSYLHAGSHLLYFGQRWGSPFIPCLHWMARQALGLGWQVARGICYTSMNFCDLLERLSLPGYQGWPFLAWSCQRMWLSLEHRLGLLSKGSQFSLLPFWISTGIQS